ncbi:hypothetical protein [Robiginitalea sp. IMCC43444]|uniref:hypothetical protein n=1 Tax=Robiginitalea sp. IMCC43444 TaxID=3459121 RepID=UPI004041E5DB
MKRFNLLCALFFIVGIPMLAQEKYEREFRIRKAQFPESAYAAVKGYLNEARRVRFYKEIDSSKQSFEIKFKKDRLHYSIEFDKSGGLEDVEIRVKAVDLPNASYKAIRLFLEATFEKYRIRKIQQQYPRDAFSSNSETLKKAFQNLLLPELKYELIILGKKEAGYNEYEVMFDSEGNFIKLRKALPANYDHVLY